MRHDPPSTFAVEAKDIRRTYRTARGAPFEAVRGVSFSVQHGELFALLGTNGSGKTSLMEILEGHAAPSAGTCKVLGRDPLKERGAVRPRTGIVLQEGNLQGDLTVAEAARMWSGTLSCPRPIGEVLGLVDLDGRSKVQLNRLSGGERRRLDLALALMSRPDVLFLDEPTSALDPESRARVHELVRVLLSEGRTVVLTTHYLQEARGSGAQTCDPPPGRRCCLGNAARGDGLDLCPHLVLHPSRVRAELPPAS